MDSTNVQISDIYKTLLEQEISNHNVFISVLLAIVIILLGATWWWNRSGANKKIRDEVNKKFEANRIAFEDSQKLIIEQIIDEKISQTQEKLEVIEADVYRALGIGASNDRFYGHAIYWFSKFLAIHIRYDNQRFQRLGVTWMVAAAKDLQAQEKSEKHPENHLKVHYCKEVLERIDQIPDILEKEKKNYAK